MNVCCCIVAARLVAKSEVYFYGQKLSVRRYTSVASTSSPLMLERCQHENISDSASHRGSQTESSVILMPPDATKVGDSDNNDVFSLEPDMTSWWKDVDTATCSSRHHSHDSDLCVDCVELSDTVEPSSSDSLSSLQQCQTCPDCSAEEELAETDNNCKLSADNSKDVNNGSMICKLDVAEQDNEVSFCPQKSQRQSELVGEQRQQNAEQNAPSSNQTQKLYFSEEKLCLLDKIITAGNIEFPYTVRVIMAEKAVELVAAEEEIMEAKIELYELIANFSSVRLHLPRGAVKLLLSGRGQRWLQMQLASLSAIFHAKDSASPCVIGVDSSTSADAKFLLETALSSKKIPFVDHHVTFLQSTQWANAVDKFESEYFVVVGTQYLEKEIVVEGSVEVLNDIGKSIETTLRQNSRIQRKIAMSTEQFQLLMHFRVEIYDRLKSETSQHQQNRYV